MEKDRKKSIPDINEELMMNLMVDGVKKEGLAVPTEPSKDIDKEDISEQPQEKPVRRERSVRAKGNSVERYGDRFLKTHSMTRRGEKSIYIRQEYHERLSRIVQVIGGDKIPLYAYLDNILEHHFDLFEKAITEDFNEKFKPIF